MTSGVIASLIAAAVAIAYLVLAARTALRHTAAGVVKRLHRAGDELHVRLGWRTATGGTWNPRKPLGLNNPIFTPGRGVYRLLADGEIQLVWTDSRGHSETFRGPVPDRVRSRSPQRRRARRVLHLIGAVYGFVSVAGFAAGYLVGGGSPAVRGGHGVLGVLAGWLGIWLVVTALNVGRSTRRVLGGSTATPARREDGAADSQA